MENGEDGFRTTPEGRPAKDTLTSEVKPFSALIEKVTGALVAPCEILSDSADKPIEKSGAGGEGRTPPVPPPPPHAAMNIEISARNARIVTTAPRMVRLRQERGHRRQRPMGG